MNEFKDLSNAFSEVAETLREAFSVLYESTKPIRERIEKLLRELAAIEESRNDIDRTEHLRSSWTIETDTRKPSQVILNKPKFMVRRVIR